MLQTESKLDNLDTKEEIIAEARRRISRYLPEWSDHENMSDPGMALIRLFAEMTEQVVERLNQVHEKNHRQFLELLGIQLKPASIARTELTFYLSTELPIDPKDKLDDTHAFVPKGTEVTTLYEEEDEPLIFTTDENLSIRKPPKLIHIFSQNLNEKNIIPLKLGVRAIKVFSNQPKPDDAFYLGFKAKPEHPLGGTILRLEFECEKAEGTGMKPEAPPWLWECLTEDGWKKVRLGWRRGEVDTTGGLNYEEGNLVLYLPLTMKPDMLNGQLAYWLRCRHKPEENNKYSESPKVKKIVPFTLGATVRATNVVFFKEELGRSKGEPDQRFQIRHHPILEPPTDETETVEVEEREERALVFMPWKRVRDFADSNENDRHFVLDTGTGEIRFGPSIRQPDGSMKQYGRIPERGHRIRFSQYRQGGGSRGNLARRQIEVLKTTIPYIKEVTNLESATGGRDQESLEEAKERARKEMRAQERAVTVTDYENLALRTDRQIVRVKCLTPNEDESLLPGTIKLLVVPEGRNRLKEKDWSALRLNKLKEKLEDELQKYQLPTIKVEISEPRYLGIQVDAKVVRAERIRGTKEELEEEILKALNNFLTPLSLLEDSKEGARQEVKEEGWLFGGTLYKGELLRRIEQVPGVRYVSQLNLAKREIDLEAEEDIFKADDSGNEEAGTAVESLTPINEWMIKVPIDTLICSLDHKIKIEEFR